MGSTISQSESNVASFFAEDDIVGDDGSIYNHQQYSTKNNSATTSNSTNSNSNNSNVSNNNTINNNIYCVGCSDGGKTSFHNQLKSKFHMKIHKNEKIRATLIIKTCLSSIQDIIFIVMSDQERNDFIHKIKKSDPQIYDFLLNLTNITRKWEFTKSESIQYGQYIRMIWSKYKIIQELYYLYKDSHHLIDNIDVLCNEMNIIISQLSDHQKNQFLKNTKRRLNQRLNSTTEIVTSNSLNCNQLENNLYDQDDEEDGEEQQQQDAEDLYQLDNHINNIMNSKKKSKKISIFSSKFKSNFNSSQQNNNNTSLNNENNNENNNTSHYDKYSPLIKFLTIGKNETKFQFDSKNLFTILDLGGRGAEKKKWEFFLNETNADFVLFFVSMSEFNQNLIESDNINRLHESLTIYRDIINRALLRNTKDIILIFTKPDIFLHKMENNIEFKLPNIEGLNIPKMETIRPELLKLKDNIKLEINNLINLFENIHLNSFNNITFKYHIVNIINIKECQEFIEILLRQTIVKDYIENSLHKLTSINYSPFISKCLFKESKFEIQRFLFFRL
ncbi:predicted protein [Naegleria gruberi]|uniref:Predicted protein n=1 Tax=Naegleria gruberi TaxID=5762 RepID=D2VGB3_NAEGR|nr:uncharacterized protein NAEGRDRAFT_67917 [Naegleria gruberi]EFC44241.1 predicted protein [Naegleria gruberi]|eukprot:XP_002676985.1 predicted protein [Naegleria gruberi strain NEG-M]